MIRLKNTLLILILILIVFNACKNPFATREAEPPSEARTSWQFPTDPIIVLQNMKVAIEEKNVENYMKCLVDSINLFQFTPDQYEASNNAGIFEQWTLAHEQSYINKAFTSIPDDSTRTLKFSNIQRNEFPDSALIRADYTLELHHILGQSYPIAGIGQLDFWFIRRSGYWMITQWLDFETRVDTTAARFPSWSTIKASFIK
ncbi:MAG: hypothetical protein JSW07_12915 [bacterium]|nr:MAG: hypothetical protein JSW07_12915 [bacterium]